MCGIFRLPPSIGLAGLCQFGDRGIDIARCYDSEMISPDIAGAHSSCSLALHLRRALAMR